MKIVLITPYWGSNLGDAVIQEAVISNIRRRQPDAEIGMASLDPEWTGQLHGVVTFPLTVLDIAYYSHGLTRHQTPPLQTAAAPAGGGIGSVKARLKRYPRLFRLLKTLYAGLVGICRAPGVIRREIGHFIAARRFTKGARMVLVSGGGQIDDYWGGPWGHPYSLLKWGLVAKSVGARYAFIGVGVCALESRLSTWLIHPALRIAAFRSFRDQKSKAMLQEMRFTHRDAVCPDLAFGLETKRLRRKNTCLNPMGKSIGVSPIAYLRHNWPKKDMQVYDQYVQNLIKFLSFAIEEGYSVLFFTTDSPDRHSVEEIVELLERSQNPPLGGKISKVSIDSVDDFFEHISEVDYVVASRLHGVILSHLARKPVLAISYDRKVDTYMEDMGFPEFCVDIRDFSAPALIEKFKTITLEADDIVRKVDSACNESAIILDQQYDLLIAGLNERNIRTFC